MDPNKGCKNLDEVFALVEDQLLHLRTLQQKQSALFAAASAAGETAEARVAARGREAEVRLDESSLADHEFTELAAFVADASREVAEVITQPKCHNDVLHAATDEEASVNGMLGRDHVSASRGAHA